MTEDAADRFNGGTPNCLDDSSEVTLYPGEQKSPLAGTVMPPTACNKTEDGTVSVLDPSLAATVGGTDLVRKIGDLTSLRSPTPGTSKASQDQEQGIQPSLSGTWG
ncbi:hypothetical protein IscW_ISCW002780 [Ixodes scapularis]|uniref:Uncharacterized protein n=1 Tax=Ixodes scapularis TaxID=6945 RepID=B7P7H7_IXOSC|nr:hypothetical protein IscW_ISCW002780 [Ixodes scapularis]|eukprot:XP_002399219.1 hypothetical protein IscW_ISCW002780 [Ixodes scapularis]